MKKDQLRQESVRRYSRLIVFLFCFIAVHVVLAPLFYFVVKPYLLSEEGQVYSEIIGFAYITLLATLPPLFAYGIAFKKEYHNKLFNYFEAKREKKIALIQAFILKENNEMKSLIQEAKEIYPIGSITPVEDGFTFLVQLLSPLVKNPLKEQGYLLPEVTVNGIEVATKMRDLNYVFCYVRPAIFAKDRCLVFNFGKGNTHEIPNPFFMDTTCTENIVWQCEGHASERRIFIPVSYFPNAVSDLLYVFELKIHKTHFGKFYGSLDESGKTMVITLTKDVHRRECDNNKIPILSLSWGNKEKITLPRPSVLFRDGSLLQSA